MAAIEILLQIFYFTSPVVYLGGRLCDPLWPDHECFEELISRFFQFLPSKLNYMTPPPFTNPGYATGHNTLALI